MKQTYIVRYFDRFMWTRNVQRCKSKREKQPTERRFNHRKTSTDFHAYIGARLIVQIGPVHSLQLY